MYGNPQLGMLYLQPIYGYLGGWFIIGFVPEGNDQKAHHISKFDQNGPICAVRPSLFTQIDGVTPAPDFPEPWALGLTEWLPPKTGA